MTQISSHSSKLVKYSLAPEVGWRCEATRGWTEGKYNIFLHIYIAKSRVPSARVGGREWILSAAFSLLQKLRDKGGVLSHCLLSLASFHHGETQMSLLAPLNTEYPAFSDAL